MIPIREYETGEYSPKAAVTKSPGPGWVRQWHGLYLPPEHYYWGYGQVERFCFLAVVQHFAGKHMTLFELGAGRADWCMGLAGMARFKTLPGGAPASYRALAVEAEPTHYRRCKQCVEMQDVNATVVRGAVSSKVGKCKFLSYGDPVAWFGQRIARTGEDGITVPMYTVDHLREQYEFDQINLIHMDVQGEEAEVVRGAQKSIAAGRVGFLLIETHNAKCEIQLRGLLSPTHNPVVDLCRDGEDTLAGFSRKIKGSGGGVQLWQKK